MSPHISEQFDLELAQVRDRFMEMGGLVETLVRDAATALVNHNAELAQQVRNRDAQVNRLELEIDELCKGGMSAPVSPTFLSGKSRLRCVSI